MVGNLGKPIVSVFTIFRYQSMSRLPKAPLIEVIFELRWTSTDGNEEYLYGDLFPLIKEKYPFRETTGLPIGAGIFVGSPTHRFRAAVNDYPLVQIGPGVLTVNTIDAKYSWKEYESWIMEVLGKFYSIYPLNESNNVKLTLQYVDLIRFDFEKDDVIAFMRQCLHIEISQDFYKSNSIAKNVGLALNYDNDLGTLTIGINRGKSLKGEDGIAIQTNLTSRTIDPNLGIVSEWIAKAHVLTSSLFKEMTRGKLQETFASK